MIVARSLSIVVFVSTNILSISFILGVMLKSIICGANVAIAPIGWKFFKYKLEVGDAIVALVAAVVIIPLLAAWLR